MSQAIELRSGGPEDGPVCGRIVFEAFKAISSAHNFPWDMPSVEVATGLVSGMLANPGFYCVVAERDGQFLGSNFLDERGPVYGVGPITVDPEAQNKSIGRRLMSAVMERAAAKSAAGVRLVQAAYHNRSLCLYTKLGFETREPLSKINGQPPRVEFAGYRVRAVTNADLEACNAVCHKVHGHDRSGELKDAVAQGTAMLVEHLGRVTGYATQIGFMGHAVGETNTEIQALIGAAPEIAGGGFLLPTRNGALFRWCLENDLKLVHQLTLMSVGLYNEPTGAYLPSVLF